MKALGFISVASLVVLFHVGCITNKVTSINDISLDHKTQTAIEEISSSATSGGVPSNLVFYLDNPMTKTLLTLNSDITPGQVNQRVGISAAGMTVQQARQSLLSEKLRQNLLKVYRKEHRPGLNDKGQWDPLSGYLGMYTRYFTPKARVFIDSGRDDDNEVDVFDNGNLNLAISMLELYFAFGNLEDPDTMTETQQGLEKVLEEISGKNGWRKVSHWRFGPVFGVGIGSPPEDGEGEGAEKSSAPIVLATLGGLLEFPITEKNKRIVAGIEGGFAYGYSADENIEDKSDAAWYVGLSFRY